MIQKEEPITAEELQKLKKRVDRSMMYRKRWDSLLRDLYDYVLPYRNDFSSATPGATLTDNIFDGTAPGAAFRFAGRMQQDLTPPFQPFFKLEAGPATKLRLKGEEIKKFDEQLGIVSSQVLAAISTSSFHLSAHEMYLDLFGGTGAMLINEGDDSSPVQCTSVPILELAMEAGPYGGIWARHWVRSFPAEQLPVMFSKGKFSDTLRQKIDKEGDLPVGICQSSVWDPEEKCWDFTVFEYASTDGKAPAQPTGNNGGAIWAECTRRSPWITPRFMVVPGEPYGRGPGLLALPFVKTLNKAVEMDLKAAALALYGIWLSRDEDFNTDTLRFQPGSVWNVGTTGGALGPSLVKADVPGKFDLSRIVTDEQRMQIKRAMFDDTLPPDTGAVRSPTEIMERMKRLNSDFGGVLGRLTLEIIQPTVERVIEILANKKVLQSDLSIDQLTVGLKVVSPVADAQQAAEARKTVDYAQMISMLKGPQAVPRYLRDQAFVDLARGIGVREELLTSEAERQAFDQRAAAAHQHEQNADINKEIVKGAIAGGIRPNIGEAVQ